MLPKNVISSLENVIDYVDYMSGSYIPASHGNYIIAQINLMIDAIEGGAAACCEGNRPANPGLAPAAETLKLEANPNPFREEVSIRFYLPEAGITQARYVGVFKLLCFLFKPQGTLRYAEGAQAPVIQEFALWPSAFPACRPFLPYRQDGR